MSFVPQEDFRYRGRRNLGPDGCRANTSLELRDFTEHHWRRPPPCRDDINSAHASIMSGQREMFSNILQKPTCDFPKGGIIAKPFVKPDFFASLSKAEPVTHITPHPKRLQPLVRSDGELRQYWSDGRDREISSAAKKMESHPSVIRTFNAPPLEPLHLGKRQVVLPSCKAPIPEERCIRGFRGLGNRSGEAHLQNIRPNRESAIRTNAVPFSDTKFLGKRKTEW